MAKGGPKINDLRGFNFALFSLLILIIHGILHDVYDGGDFRNALFSLLIFKFWMWLSASHPRWLKEKSIISLVLKLICSQLVEKRWFS